MLTCSRAYILTCLYALAILTLPLSRTFFAFGQGGDEDEGDSEGGSGDDEDEDDSGDAAPVDTPCGPLERAGEGPWKGQASCMAL
jgi:hypothetical protein